MARTERDYSATPLPKKLGIREGARVTVLGAPAGVAALLAPMPEGVDVARRIRRDTDVAVLFVTSEEDLARRFSSIAGSLTPAGGLWVAYPKKASKVVTDVDFSLVQRVGLDAGLVDNKSCAIDEVWTAVRFVVRRADRPAGGDR